jgi:Fis family transcriptional regulator
MNKGYLPLSDQDQSELAQEFSMPQSSEIKGTSTQGLRNSVKTAVDSYFAQLDGQMATDLYDMFLSEVEAPLLESVLRHTGNNQSKTAAVLGLNRGTLRKKLKKYGYL